MLLCVAVAVNGVTWLHVVGVGCLQHACWISCHGLMKLTVNVYCIVFDRMYHCEVSRSFITQCIIVKCPGQFITGHMRSTRFQYFIISACTTITKWFGIENGIYQCCHHIKSEI